MKTRTYITKSKAGHYTLTVKDLETRMSVSRPLLSTLSHAQGLVPELTLELEAFLADRKARYGV
jgi:hypothetical protein